MKRTTRYQAAIIDQERILLLKVTDHGTGRTFWVIPGGGREFDETEEACVIREAFEETCLEVEVIGLLLDETVTGDDTYTRAKTYACRVTGGELRPGREPEVDTDTFATIQDVGWFDLGAPHTWNLLMHDDPITYPLVQRIRAVLGYSTLASPPA